MSDVRPTCPDTPITTNLDLDSFGSQQSYELATMYPDITDAIILQGFSFNGSFLPTTTASFHSKIARLNQPIRFGSGVDNQALVNEALAFVSQVTGDAQLSQEIVNTTELWDLVAGYDGNPPPIGQDLPTNYLTWSDAWANQYNVGATWDLQRIY